MHDILEDALTFYYYPNVLAAIWSQDKQLVEKKAGQALAKGNKIHLLVPIKLTN